MEQIDALTAENKALKEKLSDMESVEKRKRLISPTSELDGRKHVVLGEF
jgi:hypothetical protein